MAAAQTQPIDKDENAGIITLGNGYIVLEMETPERRVFKDGKPLHLARYEKIILFEFAERSGHVVSKDELSDFWGEDGTTDLNLNAHLMNLIKKLAPFGSSVMTIPDRGYILWHDKLTRIEGNWVRLHGLCIDLNTGITIGQDKSALLMKTQLDILKYLCSRSNTYTVPEEKKETIKVAIHKMRRFFRKFSETEDVTIIGTANASYVLAVPAEKIAAPTLPAHTIQMLVGKKQKVSQNKKRAIVIRKRFEADVYSAPVYSLPTALPQRASHRDLEYDLAQNCIFLAGQKIPFAGQSLFLLSALILAARENAGIKATSNFCTQKTRAFLNRIFLNAVVPVESLRPHVLQAGNVIKLIYPNMKPGQTSWDGM